MNTAPDRVPIDLLIRGVVVQVHVTWAERREIFRALEGRATSRGPVKRGSFQMAMSPDVAVQGLERVG